MDRIKAVCGAAALWLAAGTAMAQAIQVDRVTPYASRTAAPEAVQAECGLETVIPRTVADDAEGLVKLVDRTSPAAAGRVLTMRITEVIAKPGGKYSGKKSVTLEGELLENGVIVGSFATRRERGSFIVWRGTCSIVHVAAEDTGKDVARWLRRPQMNSLLGLAKRISAPAPVAALPPVPALASGLAPLAPPAPTPAQTGRADGSARAAIARQAANLRSRPTRGGGIVQSVAAGADLQVTTQLQNSDGTWWWVVNVGKGGWIRDADVELR